MAIRRISRIPVRSVQIEDLRQFVCDVRATPASFHERNIVLISHFDAVYDSPDLPVLWEAARELRDLATRVHGERRHSHFTFLHRDPTTSNEYQLDGQHRYRDVIDLAVEQGKFDVIVCVGPRMRNHVLTEWPALHDHILELGAGMTPLHTSDGVNEPILKPRPQKTNVRVLFGSPTTATDAPNRGLDVFARAAGIVQAHFSTRRVDVTFVVSGVSLREDGADGPISDLLASVERSLVGDAAREFDGLTEFEVRELQGPLEWLQGELVRADVFVLPSRDEPYGIVAAEALSRGKPVVVSQNSGFGESLLQLAADSFLPIDRYVCVLTPRALAKAIIRAIEDDRSARLFQRVAEDAYPRLSWTNAVHQIFGKVGVPAQSFRQVIDVSEAGKGRLRSGAAAPAGGSEVMISAGSGYSGVGPSVAFNVPVVTSPVLHEYDSNRGRLVTLEALGADRVIRKRYLDGAVLKSGASAVEVRDQWEYIERRLGRRLYPGLVAEPGAVLDPRQQIVMEYVTGGSLDRIEAHRASAVLARRSIELLIRSVQQLGVPAVEQDAWAFCEEQSRLRARRLETVSSKLSEAELDRVALGSVIEDCEAFVRRCRSAVRGSPPAPMRYAVHGDFGLNNVVTFSPDHSSGSDQLRFIDTRADWAQSDGASVPIWDLAMDLASLYVFAVLVHPLLFDRFNFGFKSPLSTDPGEIPRMIESVVIDLGYPAQDPSWRSRVEACCAIRILGSIGVQLVSAQFDGVERARAVAGLLRSFLASEQKIDWGRGN